MIDKLYADDQYDETELETDKNETENDKGDKSAGVEETKEILEFTIEGLQAAIDRLTKGKAGDSNGIRAEDINKACDEETKEMMRQIFNEVLKQRDCIPEAWRRMRIKVVYVEEAGNYRPICTHQRCTNWSQRSCATDFTSGLTADNQTIREDFDAHSKL